jgi:hypothetical protein
VLRLIGGVFLAELLEMEDKRAFSWPLVLTGLTILLGVCVLPALRVTQEDFCDICNLHQASKTSARATIPSLISMSLSNPSSGAPTPIQRFHPSRQYLRLSYRS